MSQGKMSSHNKVNISNDESALLWGNCVC